MRTWLGTTIESVRVPMTVVQETAYLMSVRIGPRDEAAFLRSLAGGNVLEPLEDADIARAADLVEKYADLAIGFVDASIVAIAERLDITDVLTTDRRHFSVIRPAHCPRLRLLP